MPQIPIQLLGVLPLLVAIVSGLLGAKRLPSWANDLVVLVVLVGFSTLSAFATKSLTGDISTDILVIAGLTSGLMQIPQMQGLLTWLQNATPSPLGLLVPSGVAATPSASAATPPVKYPVQPGQGG